MQITNFNAPEPEPTAPPAATDEATETAWLRARIEHLELVVETARGLMTSNQEKLLRRLHDLPQEMIALNARMARLGLTAEFGASETPLVRRVK